MVTSDNVNQPALIDLEVLEQVLFDYVGESGTVEILSNVPAAEIPPLWVQHGISARFDADELECLVRTAAEAVHGNLDDLSVRQTELAQRAHDLLQADAATNDTLTSLVIDWDRLPEWVATLDSSSRRLLGDALRNAETADAHRTLLELVREVLAEESPDREAVGVVFHTTRENENGIFLQSDGTVRYADGSTEDIDFGDEARETFDSQFGSVGSSLGVLVNLRSDTVEAHYSVKTLRRSLRNLTG